MRRMMDVCLHQRRRRDVTAPWNGDESGSSSERLPSRGSIFKNLTDRGALNSCIEGWRALRAFYIPDLKKERGGRQCVDGGKQVGGAHLRICFNAFQRSEGVIFSYLIFHSTYHTPCKFPLKVHYAI